MFNAMLITHNTAPGLAESFNKPQLLLTFVVLTAGLLVTNPMVAGKTLRSRW